MVTVADCEAAQTCWYRCRAELLGEEWSDGPLLWVREEDHLSLMFPAEIPASALRRGVERARECGVRVVGAWLGLETDASALAAAGFERGWAPWWMTARVADVGDADDPRIELQEDTLDYQGEYAGYRAWLALTRERPQHSWYAAAYDEPGGRFAGRAWSHLNSDGAMAGVFDMNVWPPFRRRGLGAGLLRAVVGAAAKAGARDAVLNATPEGKLLYESCGFRQIGEGITWWLHMPRESGRA
ncbi:MAG: GNAT family N-acetyltransferase [Catenulispora sp.]|nr:GNAT family N-acetyltransferase [Catenulispora sp.]